MSAWPRPSPSPATASMALTPAINSISQPAASTATISARALTVTASDQTKTYASDALGTSAFTSAGLQNGETIGSVTLTAVDINALGTSTSGNRNVGTWRITPSNASGGTF